MKCALYAVPMRFKVSSGYLEFKTDIKGTIYLTCNVTTPIDSYPDEPD